MEVCLNVPSVVYGNSWLSQISDLGSEGSPVSTFEFTEAGQYRVSISLEVICNEGTPGGSGASVSINAWDSYLEGGISDLTVSASGSNLDRSSGVTIPFSASSGQTLTFYTSVTNGGGYLSGYNLYITIEQLQ